MDTHSNTRNPRRKRLKRHQLDSLILHFDCFYASVFENENPEYRRLPLAVQQKQIVVTCNYVARERGIKKLCLIKDAKRICPDLVIVLGEDLTRFRNASKDLYAFLKSFSWNHKVERLGFDEVFMDVSDMVDYNVGLLNANDLANSFFCLSKNDPTLGFAFDAAQVAGGTYPEALNATGAPEHYELRLRLHLGSHLAKYLRDSLQHHKGYTCAVGVSTNKLLSKLVGNLHKPNGQTTLLPPYDAGGDYENDDDGNYGHDAHDTGDTDNVTPFIDSHEVGKIPGIGFKIAQKLRYHVLGRPSELDLSAKENLVLRDERNVLVRDVRTFPGMNAETLDRILGGPGAPNGIGAKVWGLLNGCDDTEVGQAREVPKQISIEDSYLRLDTVDQVVRELHILAPSLLKRMHVDLMETDDDNDDGDGIGTHDESKPPPNETETTSNQTVALPEINRKRWLAFPKTIRLTTRPRPAQNPDGSRNRSFARISCSSPMPNFVFSTRDPVSQITDRLVSETLIPLFRRLHPERSGWNLSLVNVAATNMLDAASDTAKGGVGRDIAKMFKRQDDVLKQFKLIDDDDEIEVDDDEPKMEQEEEEMIDVVEEEQHLPRSHHSPPPPHLASSIPNQVNTSNSISNTPPHLSQVPSTDVDVDNNMDAAGWESDDQEFHSDLLHPPSSSDENSTFRCPACSAVLPIFALEAHERWHLHS